MVSVESVGLDATRVGYSWRLWAGDLVPTALAAGWLGASGWVAGCKRVGGWVQAGRAAASSTKTDVKGKAIQSRDRGGPSRGRKSASLLKICGSSKA